MAMEATYNDCDEEDNFIVAQATEPIGEDGCLVNARVTAGTGTRSWRWSGSASTTWTCLPV